MKSAGLFFSGGQSVIIAKVTAKALLVPFKHGGRVASKSGLLLLKQKHCFKTEQRGSKEEFKQF